jgi:hypothetical protein
MQRLPIFQRSILMKTLITVLAVTAILATSVAAQTTRNRHKAVPVPHTNGVYHNAVSHNPVYPNSNCRFEHRENDPDPRVLFQLYRDCREHELTEVE